MLGGHGKQIKVVSGATPMNTQGGEDNNNAAAASINILNKTKVAIHKLRS